MSAKESNDKSYGNFGKSNYLEILLRQYKECWADVRNYSNLTWQVPAVLVAITSFLGLLYGYYLRHFQIGRIVVLMLAFGFTLVSIIALLKHRFFSKKRVEDLEDIQKQLKKLLSQKEFEDFKGWFREIKWKSQDLAKDCCPIYRTSAYAWQLRLAIVILIGISILLLGEFILLLDAYL